jgi:hypothetical protein
MCEPANAPQVQVSIKAVNLLHETKQLFQRGIKNFCLFYGQRQSIYARGDRLLSLYGNEPSAIEQVFAIYANVIEWMITETF